MKYCFLPLSSHVKTSRDIPGGISLLFLDKALVDIAAITILLCQIPLAQLLQQGHLGTNLPVAGFGGILLGGNTHIDGTAARGLAIGGAQDAGAIRLCHIDVIVQHACSHIADIALCPDAAEVFSLLQHTHQLTVCQLSDGGRFG